jgi:hypothetical protein
MDEVLAVANVFAIERAEHHVGVSRGDRCVVGCGPAGAFH